MNHRLAIFSLLVAYGLYLALISIGGTAGLIEYARLEDYQQVIEHHIEDLDYRQQLLLAEVRDLQQNDQRLLIEARSVGFYLENEYVIRLNGINDQPYLLTSGKRLPTLPVGKDYRPIIRIIALGSGLFIYVVGFFLERPASSSKEEIARPSM